MLWAKFQKVDTAANQSNGQDISEHKSMVITSVAF
jgi:hypothetical protein